MGVNDMKKIVTFAAVVGGALALAACGAKKEEAPAEAAATEAAPAEEAPAATDEAAAAADGLDPTGNPIGMDKPAAGADSMSADSEAPAAE